MATTISSKFVCSVGSWNVSAHALITLNWEVSKCTQEMLQQINFVPRGSSQSLSSLLHSVICFSNSVTLTSENPQRKVTVLKVKGWLLGWWAWSHGGKRQAIGEFLVLNKKKGKKKERKRKIKWFLKSFALNAVKVVNHYCKSVSPHAVEISTLNPGCWNTRASNSIDFSSKKETAFPEMLPMDRCL